MGKKLRAKIDAVGELQSDDQMTKPNIRLVKAMSGRPQYVKKELKLDFPAARLEGNPDSGTASWLPYLFGALLVLGFTLLQNGRANSPEGRPASAAKAVAVVEEKAAPSSNFSSPLMETVRRLGKKDQR